MTFVEGTSWIFSAVVLQKKDFKAKLFDVPGMQHTTCSGEILSTALDFIESASQH